MSAAPLTRPVARPFAHSSPSRAAAGKTSRSSAAPLASHALRSHRLSNTGVLAVTESMIDAVGREAGRVAIRRPGRCCWRTVLVRTPVTAGEPRAGLMRCTAAFTRAANGAGVLTSSRFAPMSSAPAWPKCVWSSMKPGVMNRPPASITRVRGVRWRSASALVPTATRRSPRTASACADGRGWPVQMRALRTMKSAS